MNLKIVITGSSDFSLLASKVLGKLSIPNWIKLEISEHPIESLLEGGNIELGQTRIEPATIIISGEQSSKMIEQRLNTIVVPVKIIESEVLVSLAKSTPGQHIAIINYRTRFENIDWFAKQLNLNISQYSFETLKEIYDVFEVLSKKKIDKIIGGSYACKIANDYGMKSSFLYSENSLREAILTAIKFLEIYRKEMEQAALFKTVSGVNKSGIVSIDEANKITSVNKIVEELFGLSKDKLVGQNMERWINKEQLMKGGNDRQIIFTVKHRTFIAVLSPVYVAREKVGNILVIDDVKEIQKKELSIRSKINKKTMKAQYHFTDIIGPSEALNKVKKTAEKFSRSSAPILIQGESGTGKELFAQSIHNESNRNEAAFVAINCAAIPENLLDSELFGYEDGAFTGAKKGGKKGLFELAHQGTIFLDEINALPLHLQSKLLRVLQEKEVMKIGGDSVIPVNIRVVTAANEDLMESVQKRTFREDLYYRINVLQLIIPPLRERKEDIAEITRHHLNLWEDSQSLIMPSILNTLQQYSFPGNVRELKNILERFQVYCEGEELNEKVIKEMMRQALSPKMSESFAPLNLSSNSLNLKEQEDNLIKAALDKHQGRKDLAAKELGISRATLWRKLND
ncbi:hypothetical protein CWR48_06300 [Oceanobacillus arenosus]|uniref:Sigma-54-dependent Fis family transcriptional regulator n=1 Tax=Oceanobacillus arenosus TaxID=1229153 RepID=A0A3D8PVY4_9BACI|nr:sigma 54-interacting transcriptional regulator [Oceanobacillus arenosus]RDW20296.1 hypothetical protein CWR48_06300 [Oceanobacillus arenosus]